MTEAFSKDYRPQTIADVEGIAAPSIGWSVLRWTGWTLFLIGMLDIALAWYPLRLGNTEWEFGTVSATMDAMPLPLVGLLIALAASVALGSTVGLRVVALTCWLMALWLAAAVVIYGLDVPIALRAVQDPVARLGLKKAIAKGLSLGLAYPLLFVWCSIVVRRRLAAITVLRMGLAPVQ